MKKVGIILICILTSLQVFAAQPLEYQGEASFCERVFHYIREKPVYAPPPPRVIHYAPTPGATLPVPSTPQIKLTRTLPPIDSVFIRGGVDIEIIGCQGKNKLSVKRVYPGLAVKVCDNSIYISNSKPVACNQNPRPCMRLYINELKRLVVAGDSCIKGCNLHTYCGLNIEHCGGGTVCINGPTHLVRIATTGTATICIPHVTSDHVHILATRSSEVKLRGSTGLLLVRAFQNATVDTRFMCTRTALIQASDESLVTVKATDSLQAFASKMSNIYYYTAPGELLQHNTLSGNVFQMGAG